MYFILLAGSPCVFCRAKVCHRMSTSYHRSYSSNFVSDYFTFKQDNVQKNAESVQCHL